MPSEERIYYLFNQYIEGSATSEELDELTFFLNNNSYEEIAKNHLLSLLRVTEPMAVGSGEDRLQVVLRKIREEAPTLRNTPKLYSRQLPAFRRWWAVAALLAGAAVAVWLVVRKPQSSSIAERLVRHHDAAPGRNVAVLTLADGSSITLDSAHNGVLAQQGNSNITKSGDGALAYQEAKGVKAAAVYNTLSTPRGGQYKLVLPDGSQVWLNAASSISYPTAFTDSERDVTITGEAYFEIAPNARMPFRVHVDAPQGQKDIRVLGTHFNVKAYGDETTITTTLLEGSVQLVNTTTGTILQPGEQGQWHADGSMHVNAHADIEEAMAWKNGLFHFEGADLGEVMRQIARWYDVDVEFRGKIPEAKFEGEINRNSNLTDVFKILQLSNVHFTVEDKKVIVEQ